MTARANRCLSVQLSVKIKLNVFKIILTLLKYTACANVGRLTWHISLSQTQNNCSS